MTARNRLGDLETERDRKQYMKNDMRQNWRNRVRVKREKERRERERQKWEARSCSGCVLVNSFIKIWRHTLLTVAV